MDDRDGWPSLPDAGVSTRGVADVLSPSARVKAMLRFEAALAASAAEAGVIPAAAGEAVAAACDLARVDAEAILRAGWEVGTPVLALVERLRELVAPEHRPHVHVGATTQDVVDTATVLQLRAALEPVGADLAGVADACADLARAHRDTPMVARTFGQHAGPVTFGLVVASWLDAVLRHRDRLRGLDDLLVVQLGGPVGTLAGLGERAESVAAGVGRRLGLPVPVISWHSSRDRVVVVAQALAALCTTTATIAGDVARLASTEIAEVSVRAGGSSSIPGKRNPIDAVRADAAARIARGNAAVVVEAGVAVGERPVGAWHAEWVALPLVVHASAASVEAVLRLLGSLEPDVERMASRVARDADLGRAGAAVDAVLAAHARG